MVEARTEKVITLNKSFVSACIVSIIGGIITIGGYMIAWNRSDLAHKTVVLEKLNTMSERIGKLEISIEKGILPEARWRMNAVERDLEAHEKYHQHLENSNNRVSP